MSDDPGNKRIMYLLDEAKKRGLYWTGGGWCDWVDELTVEIEQKDQRIADLSAALRQAYLDGGCTENEAEEMVEAVLETAGASAVEIEA